MAYENLKSMLDDVQQQRLRLCDRLAADAEAIDDELSRDLRERLIERQQLQAEHVDELMHHAPAEVLDTWLQYTDQESNLSGQVSQTVEGDKDDVVAATMAFDSRVLRIMRLIREQIEGPQVESFMDDLIGAEEQKAKLNSRDVNETLDVRSL